MGAQPFGEAVEAGIGVARHGFPVFVAQVQSALFVSSAAQDGDGNGVEAAVVLQLPLCGLQFLLAQPPFQVRLAPFVADEQGQQQSDECQCGRQHAVEHHLSGVSLAFSPLGPFALQAVFVRTAYFFLQFLAVVGVQRVAQVGVPFHFGQCAAGVSGRFFQACQVPAGLHTFAQRKLCVVLLQVVAGRIVPVQHQEGFRPQQAAGRRCGFRRQHGQGAVCLPLCQEEACQVFACFGSLGQGALQQGLGRSVLAACDERTGFFVPHLGQQHTVL